VLVAAAAAAVGVVTVGVVAAAVAVGRPAVALAGCGSGGGVAVGSLLELLPSSWRSTGRHGVQRSFLGGGGLAVVPELGKLAASPAWTPMRTHRCHRGIWTGHGEGRMPSP